MNVKHNPIFKTDAVADLYSKRDGVPIKYVCTSAINGGDQEMDIFYRADGSPHPEFGNRYFGMYVDYEGFYMITGADMVEDLEFVCVENDEGELEYSAYRHDCKTFENGNMIDGGRAYTRSTANNLYPYMVYNGEFRPFNELMAEGVIDE